MTDDEALALRPGDLVAFNVEYGADLGAPLGAPLPVERIEHDPNDHDPVKIWNYFKQQHRTMWTKPKYMDRVLPPIDDHTAAMLEAFTT